MLDAADRPTRISSERKLKHGQAANAALVRVLTDTPEAFYFGEDCAKPGGVFGTTRGLAEQFGDRVFDTPISETAMLGSAVGAALMGARPIVEIMWVDFTLVALDQIVNQAANARYVSGGRAPAPIVVRTQQGNAPAACAQHSQSLESVFLHVPGIRVVMPWSAQDIYDAILSAVACDDPVIVIENRTLYDGQKHDVTVDAPVREIGWSNRLRSGTDVTIVTWGAMTATVFSAAEELESRGVGADVIELTWLNPTDMSSVRGSLERTGRLVVVHEANLSVGFGAEIVARVVETDIELRSRPLRIATPDMVIPAHPRLAGEVIPSVQRIIDEISTLVGIRK
jgi:pyruvate/2-oxoglutarate/acetoin dehydrogenase E1 component